MALKPSLNSQSAASALGAAGKSDRPMDAMAAAASRRRMTSPNGLPTELRPPVVAGCLSRGGVVEICRLFALPARADGLDTGAGGESVLPSVDGRERMFTTWA